MASIQKIRNSAYTRQNGRCYYCGFSMWQESAKSFAKLNGMTVMQARDFQCTAEHLVARQDGGRDVARNIAAACFLCNQRRHHMRVPLEPEKYQKHVREHVKKGKWHVANLASR